MSGKDRIVIHAETIEVYVSGPDAEVERLEGPQPVAAHLNGRPQLDEEELTCRMWEHICTKNLTP